MEKLILNNKEVELLSREEKILYYSQLKDYCLNYKAEKNNSKFIQKIVNKLAPKIRNYDFDITGIENIPLDGKALFVINHSNAHDFFTMQEAFSKIGIEHTFLASNEDLNSIILTVFKSCNGVLFNRSDKNSINKAFIEFACNMVNGMAGVIYAESTWNLHPYKPMHLIKTGAVNLAAVSEIPIIPTIFEYIETPELCTKEANIYSKCIVKFDKPINIFRTENIIKQTNIVQDMLEISRKDLWENQGIKRGSINDINQEIYLNHTYLKKFGGAGEYDTEREMKHLLIKDKLSGENEYHLDQEGKFVPGILSKEEGKKYIKQ